MLQWAAGAGFGDLLNAAEQAGFFRLILPILLIFALVYAILSQIKVFKDNKGALALVSISVAVLSIQLGVVPAFFQNIFPKVGVGLSILLAALILAGAFISEDKDTFKWVFFGLGGLIFVFVLFSSLTDWKFVSSGWWSYYGGLVVSVIIIITAVVLVIKFGGGD